MTNLVVRQDADGVASLTLNRPDKLNALNVELFQELADHVSDIAGQTDSVVAWCSKVPASASPQAMI